MVWLEKAILLNNQGILLFGTPGDFAFSRKDMFKEPSYLLEDVIAH